MKVVALWSGGKDSCFATYKAMESGLEVSYLLNFIARNGTQSLSHHLNSQLISLQTDAIGIPLIQKPTGKGEYEEVFKSTLAKLKEEGVEGGVFGDIYLQAHKDWVDRVCREVGINPILPLWLRPTREIVEEFISCGFETIVVCAKADVFTKDWPGRKIDSQFIRDLGQLNEKIDPCGENGEFHTFVIDGPIFKYRIEVTGSQPYLKDGRWCLDIATYKSVKKEKEG